MSLIDFILNVAGILLWLNWRSVAADPFIAGTPATLSGTLRRAQPTKAKRWNYLTAISVLLLLRAVLYRLIGPEVNWVPRLHLFFIDLGFHFGPSFFGSIGTSVLFSVLSFLRVFLICYFWLMVLVALDRNPTSGNPIQKLITLQLGSLAQWPRVVQIIFPLLLVALLWIALHPVLVAANVANRVHAILNLCAQGLLIGLAIVLTLKYLLVTILAAHLISSYVYFGRSALWDWFDITARNFLKLFKLSSLRAAKIDLAPIAGIVLVLLLLQILPDWALVRFGNNIWPQ
jgi:hypothetical protein